MYNKNYRKLKIEEVTSIEHSRKYGTQNCCKSSTKLKDLMFYFPFFSTQIKGCIKFHCGNNNKNLVTFEPQASLLSLSCRRSSS